MRVTDLVHIDTLKQIDCPLLVHLGFKLSDKVNALTKIFDKGEFYIGTVEMPDGMYYGMHQIRDGSIVFVEQNGEIADGGVFIDNDMNILQFIEDKKAVNITNTDISRILFNQTNSKENAWGAVRFVFNTIVSPNDGNGQKHERESIEPGRQAQ